MAKKDPAAPAAPVLNPGNLVDGIYVGLDEAVYHADPALGSSDIRTLLKGANQYWWRSWLNPKRPVSKRTDSLILGSAVHKILLEGIDEFRRFYVRGPYTSDSDLSPADKSALTKAAKKTLLEGQELLKADDFDFCVGVRDVIDQDPELTGCLDNGLSELSVFWTRPDGVRCKVRMDKCKRRGIGDIKTIANERERELEEACKLDIKTYRYDVPAEHYLEGYRQMGRLLDEARLFVGDGAKEKVRNITAGVATKAELTLLGFLRECVEEPDLAFQLVFVPKTGAPDAWSTVLSPGNEILMLARTDIETAIAIFKRAMADFGTKTRWLPRRPVGELSIEEMPFGFGRLPTRR